MSVGRQDALELALAALRCRLREGAFPPGGRIAASALAASLRLSATPVREALSRLAGEGLVEERRNQGFFVRTLSGVDIGDLYRIGLAQLLILAGSDRALRWPRVAPSGEDPIRAVEDLLLGWTAAVGSRALIQTYRTVTTQLGPVRRAEAKVFDDLAAEADALFAVAAGGDAVGFTQALRRFHGRRIQAADRLAAALSTSATI
jgi:DNA-binding GntR family transcriptional regulator